MSQREINNKVAFITTNKNFNYYKEIKEIHLHVRRMYRLRKTARRQASLDLFEAYVVIAIIYRGLHHG